MTDLIHAQLDEGLLTLRLNRADKLNALTNAMYTRLAELFEAANSDPQVEVVLITGSSECFTAGNDLPDFLEQPPTDLQSPVFRMMWAVLALDKPLIAAVAGPAIGIGTTLLLHCDQVLVSRDARLRTPFVALGVCPEFGASLLLPQMLGHARAAQLLLCNQALNGEQAVQWGWRANCTTMARNAWPPPSRWRGACSSCRPMPCVSAGVCSRTPSAKPWPRRWPRKACCSSSGSTATRQRQP